MTLKHYDNHSNVFIMLKLVKVIPHMDTIWCQIYYSFVFSKMSDSGHLGFRGQEDPETLK